MSNVHEAPTADQLRTAWLARLTILIEQFERWAKELGWETRRIDKTLRDAELGDYEAPALILQQDVARVLLDPIARSAPGAEGIVDLYRMPAYDDIASLYFYDDAWHVHYVLPGAGNTAPDRQPTRLPFAKESVDTVLAAIKQNAA
jgi:hypothetical protein